MSDMSSNTEMEIAIIGMAGRFPGAASIEKFWENVRDGVESISCFTDEELLASGVSPAALGDANYIRARGVLEDADLFDASFFGYSPREAEVLDPQHRIFLECAWEALENAGYDPEAYSGLIGVYAGTGLSTYMVNLYSNPELLASVGSFQIGLGNDKDYLASRASYKLNLEGPAITIQTACSTSLVAVHLACQALLSGECDMALAGGVTVGGIQKTGYYYQEGGIASPDGHCRAFDARARGTIGGNGAGIVVLKRLEDAIADRDYIHAVIKGTAINNDGALKVGYTAPRVEGQAAVIRSAHTTANVHPETITYIEAHGTGTELGDPIEIAALTRVFRARTEKKGFCAIGSVKTNIGHLEAAAGIAGLVKTVMALKNKQIPPSLHFTKPNPKIDFDSSPFYVNTRLTEWKINGNLRRAGVSSFGIGGTNAHAILEEFSPSEPSGQSRPSQLLLLSAKTPSALDAMTASLASHLKQNPQINLADVAYTLQSGRRVFNHRRALLCKNIDDAVQLLETREAQRLHTSCSEDKARPLVFMFTGQGSQYPDMGLNLYESEPVFRQHVDRCSELLKPFLNLDLRNLLYPGSLQVEDATQRLNQTSIAQPALFVIEYALAQTWMSWGLHPSAMIGHSIGEYVAACVAGVFSLEEALTLVAARGRLMQNLPTGTMMTVPLSEQEVRPLLGEHLSLAAVNGQSLCVVSGTADAVDELQRRLSAKGLVCRHLHTSHAFHSHMMAPALMDFRNEVDKAKLNVPQIPYISNLTGTWISEAEATDPQYWIQHLRQTVRFADGLSELMKQQDAILLEVGPGQTLSNLAKNHSGQTKDRIILSSLRRLQDSTSDDAFLLNTLGRLWLAGKSVDWKEFYKYECRRRVPLPTYPFERHRFWVERHEPQVDTNPVDARPGAASKKDNIDNWFYTPSWERSALPLAANTGCMPEKKSRWLVFIDHSGVGTQIARRLKESGHDVVTVEASEFFSRISDSVFTINPDKPGDYDSLVKDLIVSDKIPCAITHLWGVNQNGGAQTERQLFAGSQKLGFYSLIYLAQALGRQIITSPIRLHVITSDVQDVTGQEELRPDKATVIGACKVIPQEYPNITCRLIDIVTPEPGTVPGAKLIDRLAVEIEGESSDLVVAYRGIHRWIQVFDAALPRWAGARGPRLRPGGVYLITGGLGHMGLTLAEYLSQAVQAKLILVGRSSFPAKDQWSQWLLEHGDDDETSKKIRRLRSIEEAGGRVLTLSADVADNEQMRNVVACAVERFGPLNGVIHAAGATGELSVSSIQGIGQAQYEEHLRPKVEGLLVLENVLRDHGLDFCLLASSIASVLGGLGFASYCASNIFMDAFAHKKNRADSATWVSINWDTWRSDMGEDGARSPGGTLADLGLTGEEGVEVFRRVLDMDNLSQVVVSTGELQERIDQWVKLEGLREANQASGNHLALYPRPDLQGDFVAPRNELEKALVEIWQELLGIEPISVNDNFFELGGHSLLAIQLISRVRDLLQVDLNVESLFDGATIADLSLAIVRTQVGEVDGDGVSGLLEELGQLSEEDARTLLMREVGHEL